MSFEKVEKFEKIIADFFGCKYAVATDSCTHAIELCLRYLDIKNNISFPNHTYVGVPLLAYKLNLKWSWNFDKWEDYYYIHGTNIIDAAVLWKKIHISKNFYVSELSISKTHKYR